MFNIYVHSCIYMYRYVCMYVSTHTYMYYRETFSIVIKYINHVQEITEFC